MITQDKTWLSGLILWFNGQLLTIDLLSLIGVIIAVIGLIASIYYKHQMLNLERRKLNRGGEDEKR